VGVPKPSPCYLDRMDRWRVINGKQTWRSPCGKRLYQWDELHGEIEVYNKRGKHVGVLHAVSGEAIGDAEEGRTIDVS
jgi:hypothetical protein